MRILPCSGKTEFLARFANRGLAGPVRLRCGFLLGIICLAIPLVAGQPYASPADDEDSSSRSPAPLSSEQHRQRAAQELKAEEHQRILRVVPNFNTSNIADAESLSPAQKFQLAVKGGLDPFSFVAVGFDAGISQAENNFPSYGQGAKGYGKRFAASFADSFDGEILGNALLPVLLKQDPRYFRRGTGSFRKRFTYAVMSTVKCKNDNGDGRRTTRTSSETLPPVASRTFTTPRRTVEYASPPNEPWSIRQRGWWGRYSSSSGRTSRRGYFANIEPRTRRELRPLEAATLASSSLPPLLKAERHLKIDNAVPAPGRTKGAARERIVLAEQGRTELADGRS